MAGSLPRYFPYLAITNTNLPLLERIRAMYPVGRQITRTTSSIGKRPCYQLRFDGLELRRILSDVLPFLIDKQEQAKLLSRVLTKMRGPGQWWRRVPSHVAAFRDRCYWRLRAMKRVSYKPQPQPK